MTDHLLMLSVRDGDVEKLGVLFERYHSQLFNFLLHLTGDRHLSEDLVQEVFVRILKYRHAYQRENRFTSWMFQIARNARIDNFRRSPRGDRGIEDRAEEFISPLPTPSEAAERQEEMCIMMEALANLPEDRREILLLRGLQGLKFEEIAEVQQCSINTIKSRAFRAIRELKSAVNQLRGESAV
jgi:RNA polymerase sigma-70 factor (ECF subfamily)